MWRDALFAVLGLALLGAGLALILVRLLATPPQEVIELWPRGNE